MYQITSYSLIHYSVVITHVTASLKRTGSRLDKQGTILTALDSQQKHSHYPPSDGDVCVACLKWVHETEWVLVCTGCIALASVITTTSVTPLAALWFIWICEWCTMHFTPLTWLEMDSGRSTTLLGAGNISGHLCPSTFVSICMCLQDRLPA